LPRKPLGSESEKGELENVQTMNEVPDALDFANGETDEYLRRDYQCSLVSGGGYSGDQQ
jgi:hypothetical protein